MWMLPCRSSTVSARGRRSAASASTSSSVAKKPREGSSAPCWSGPGPDSPVDPGGGEPASLWKVSSGLRGPKHPKLRCQTLSATIENRHRNTIYCGKPQRPHKSPDAAQTVADCALPTMNRVLQRVPHCHWSRGRQNAEHVRLFRIPSPQQEANDESER